MSDACCSYSLLRFPLPPPANLATGAITDTSIELTWDVVENAVSYMVMWEPGGGSASVTGTTYTMTGLTAGTDYSIAVVAVADPDSKYDDSRPATIAARTTGGQLSTPTGVATTATAATTATITWDAVTGADGYTISWALASDPGTPLGSDTATAAPYQITGLTAGTDYIASVVATDSTGGSANSEPGTVAFSTTGTPQLPTPQNVTASDITATSATIAWDAVTGADDYTVVLDPPDGTVTVDPGVPNASATGLTASTPYTVSVVATDSTGASGDSDPGTGNFSTIA